MEIRPDLPALGLFASLQAHMIEVGAANEAVLNTPEIRRNVFIFEIKGLDNSMGDHSTGSRFGRAHHRTELRNPCGEAPASPPMQRPHWTS